MIKVFNKYLSKLRGVELIIIILLAIVLAYVLITDHRDALAKDRDAVRVSNINQIHYALYQYYDQMGTYPPCLYKTKGCKSLEGSVAMTEVPKDPSTDLPYAYTALGHGNYCNNYHVGTSLERKASQALLAGSDAAPEPASSLCTGSSPDFSGLSYAPGGHPCDTSVGTAQPTDDPNGETCYDLKPHRPQ
jgi:hypothetical protein